MGAMEIISENVSSSSAPPLPRPFFIMDWLEDLVADQDGKIAERLQTPNRIEQQRSPQQRRFYSPSSPPSTPGTPKSSNRKRKNNNSSPSSPPSSSRRHPPIEPQLLFMAVTKSPSKSSSSSSSIYKRSIALGNGWNAKGLKKAKQGLWQDALACWGNALEIRLQILGENHLEVANTYNNQGIALGKLGQYEGALQALHRALDIRMRLSAHPQVISTLHNLANVHHQVGNLQKAVEVFAKAKDLKPKDPIQMARICTAMGHVYYQAEQWADARDAFQDALQLYTINVHHSSKVCQQEVSDLRRDIQELDQRLARQQPQNQQSYYQLVQTNPALY